VGAGYGCYPRTTTIDSKRIVRLYRKTILLEKLKSSRDEEWPKNSCFDLVVEQLTGPSRSARRCTTDSNGQTDCHPGLGYRLKFPDRIPKSKQNASLTSGNSQNSSRLPTLFGSFELAGKTRVHLAWPASHDNTIETLFEVMGHLTYSTVYYINIFTNLSLLSVEI